MMIDDLKKGSPQAFRALVEKYSQDVISTCYGFVDSREDAEDIAQEVFIEVYRSIRRFREEAQLGTWIYRIAISKSLDFLRKQRRKKRFADLKGLFLAKHAPSVGPHQQLLDEERRGILQEQIVLLPENQKVALVLSQYEKLSNKRIAEIMTTSESAVESLLHRARANLRKKLADYFDRNF